MKLEEALVKTAMLVLIAAASATADPLGDLAGVQRS